jgi:hypothetical protein
MGGIPASVDEHIINSGGKQGKLGVGSLELGVGSGRIHLHKIRYSRLPTPDS